MSSMIGHLLRVTNDELNAYLKNSSLLEERVYNDNGAEDPKLVDIDKSWEGILFLLTGQSLESFDHPLGKALFSGQDIDAEQDLGYGPAQYLTPEQVKEVNAALSPITEEELAKKYDAKRMTELELYPSVWEEEGILDYLLEYFKDVQATYATAAANNEAVITFVS
jgi:hypothetical protein